MKSALHGVRVLVSLLLASGGPSAVLAQQVSGPPPSECAGKGADGHCSLWAPAFASILRSPQWYHNLSLRLSGYVILQCQDQTLYATLDDARKRVRLSGIRLSGHLGQLSGLTDSISHVVVDVRFGGPFFQDVKFYGGVADSVTLVRVIPDGEKDGD